MPRLALVAMSACLALHAAPRHKTVPRGVPDRYRPVPFSQQTLTGLLGHRMQANVEGFLEHIDDKGVFAADLRNSAGLFLDAAANAYDYSHDHELKSVMDRLAQRLLAQSASQNASPYANDLLGLLSYYRVTHNPDALSAARDVGQLVLARSGSSDSDATQAVSFLEPMAYLYRQTHNVRILEFCKHVASLGNQNSLSALPGLVELYRITADRAYLATVLNRWQKTRDQELNIAGGIDSSDNDLCSTASWLQLNVDLLRVTGDARYAAEIEKTTYNQLLAAQDPATGKILQSVPLAGRKTPTTGPVAHAACESRAIAMIPALAWGRYGRGVAVVLYSAGRATVRVGHRDTVQLYSETAFPENGSIALHLEPSHPIRFSLFLRVPEWAKDFRVDVDGIHQVGRPGEFLNLSHEWAHAETVNISIDMPLTVLTAKQPSTNQVALQRGPQLLAIEQKLNPEIADLSKVTLSGDTAALKLSPVDKVPSDWFGNQVYEMPAYMDKSPIQVRLAPLSDATAYRVWIALTEQRSSEAIARPN